MNAGAYSNLAMVTSVVLYVLAFFAHALEWSMAGRGPKVRAEQQLMSVGAGKAESGGEARRSAESVAEEPLAEAPSNAGRRVELFGRVGVALTLIGFAAHLVGVVLRGVAAQRLPWGNMYEFVTSALLLLAATYLVLALRFGTRWLGLPMTLLLTIGNGLAVTVFYVAVAPLVPALHSVWFVIHIAAACIGGAAFNVGAIASILYLLRSRAERKGDVTGYLARIPDSGKLDVFAYRSLAFAFPVWTFTVAAGSIWAEYAWGRYWGWDPKETWSLVTWVIYAGYLHARVTAGWKGTRAAVLAIVGVASFWFNFVGVNLLVKGLHSYAGI